MALINGSPCAAALVADVALAGRRRIELAESTLALVADAAGAPDEHYAAELEQSGAMTTKPPRCGRCASCLTGVPASASPIKHRCR